MTKRRPCPRDSHSVQTEEHDSDESASVRRALVVSRLWLANRLVQELSPTFGLEVYSTRSGIEARHFFRPHEEIDSLLFGK